MLTEAEIAVQRALYKLWYEYYTQHMPQEKRNQLAADFAEKWLDPSLIKVDKPFIRHPATRRKVIQPSFTIAEVLADFILRAMQEEEKFADYPVLNPDTELRREFDRKEKERSIVFESEQDTGAADSAESITPTKQPYSVSERELPLVESVEDELFAEITPTVDAFRRQLEKVKMNARKYARKYESQGYQYADTLRRIRRLDITRVRECLECQGAFYAHDFRRYVCDLQHGRTEKGEQTKLSTCELSADRRRSERTRNNSDKSA
ncbi:hypothetical protein [Sporosarcina sp. ITBMC105]